MVAERGVGRERRIALDTRTCFPLTEAVRAEVEAGHFPGVPVFVEEDSWCPKRSVRPPPRVPDGPVGRERLQLLLDAVNRPSSEPPPYEIVPRADGWLVAPAGRAHLSDALVTVDLQRGVRTEPTRRTDGPAQEPAPRPRQDR